MSEEERTVLKPGEVIRPYVDPDLVKNLVKRLYDLDVVKVTELNSYDDRNYHVLVSMETANTHIAPICDHGYVLKVLNSLDSRHEDYVDAQNLAILHVASKGICTPRPVPNIHGDLMSVENFRTEIKSDDCKEASVLIQKCVVRLLEYIPGRILLGVSYTANLLFQVGRMTGRLDNALGDFRHPAHEKHTRIWNLVELPNIGKFLYCIRDVKKTDQVQQILDTFRTEVIANYSRFKKGTLHGDVNDYNILVTEDAYTKRHDVTGILDFGDSINSCYVFEIAIILCYVILGSDVIDPLEAGGHTLAGYLSEFPLESTDLRVLKECVCGRFAMSLVIGAYSAENDPENAEYLLSTEQKGWSILNRVWSTPKVEIYRLWNDICRKQYGIEPDFGV